MSHTVRERENGYLFLRNHFVGSLFLIFLFKKRKEKKKQNKMWDRQNHGFGDWGSNKFGEK